MAIQTSWATVFPNFSFIRFECVIFASGWGRDFWSGLSLVLHCGEWLTPQTTMFQMIHLLILLFPLFYHRIYGRAQQTLYPPAIPLAVRSPYLSCWMFTLNRTDIAQLSPTTSAHQPSTNVDDANLDVCRSYAQYNTKFNCTSGL